MPNRDVTARTPLFRPEAIQKTHDHLGQVLIHQPHSYSLIGLLALLLILLALSFVLFGSYTRKASTPGLLIPDLGVLRIQAPTQGQVLAIKAGEGQQVRAGDPLFLLADEQISSSGELQTLVAQQLLRRHELMEQNKQQATKNLLQQHELLELQLHALQQEETQLEAEIHLLEQREQLAQNNLERSQQLLERGHISLSELQRTETELQALVMLLVFLTYKSQFTTRASKLIDLGIEIRMLSLHAERLADIALEQGVVSEDVRLEASAST